MNVTSDTEEIKSVCPCCGNNLYQGSGTLCDDADPIADYWYMWVDGHNGRFALAVRWGEINEERIVNVSCVCHPEGTRMTILEPSESPWPQLPTLGHVLNCDEAHSDADYPRFFNLFDAVISLESRLATRVREYEAL